MLPAEPPANTPVVAPLSDGEEKVLEYARTHGAVTRNEVMGLFEVSISTAARVLKKLVKRQSAKAEWKRQRHQLYTIINKRYAAQPIGKIQSAVFS